MNSAERMNIAMALGVPDRVPLMCQLSIGHYFLHSKVDPFDIWFTAEGFAAALIELAGRYNFDGVLVNLPGRDPEITRFIAAIENKDGGRIVRWKNGNYTVIPHDDNPHYYSSDGTRVFPLFEDIDPGRLYYCEPWDTTEVTYPYSWGFAPPPPDEAGFFPPWHMDTLMAVLRASGGRLSVHTEIFSPWSQFLELLNYENALLAVMDDPGKVHAVLERFTAGAIHLALAQARAGAHAVLISSAFAGAGLISREHYREFVLPYERQVIAAVTSVARVPVYTHTCGSIGDRLDLMLETGTNGIDTLDPPPLGTVDLTEAKALLSGKAFIKGNIDPVHTLLYGTPEQVRADVRQRLTIGKPNGGYILSSACSVAPATPKENLAVLSECISEWGTY